MNERCPKWARSCGMRAAVGPGYGAVGRWGVGGTHASVSPQMQSVATRGNKRQSEAIRGHLVGRWGHARVRVAPDAISGNQRQ